MGAIHKSSSAIHPMPVRLAEWLVVRPQAVTLREARLAEARPEASSGEARPVAAREARAVAAQREGTPRAAQAPFVVPTSLALAISRALI